MRLIGLVLLVFIAICFEGTAQSITTIRQNDFDYGRAFRFNKKSDGVKGTPFLFEEPPMAKVALSSGKVYDEIPVNILPEKEAVYIQIGDESTDPLVLRNWDYLTILDENPRMYRLEYINGKQRIVEILLENEKDKFVALHTKNLIKPNTVKDGYTGPQFDVYRPSTKFYKIRGMSSEEFKGSSSGIKELSGKQYSEVKNFIKKEKLKPERAVDMRRVLEFIYR